MAKRRYIPLILLLVIITGFGGFLRFSGLDWGLPWRYHVDENAFINAANAMRKAPHLNYLNPGWFYHPSLNIYLVCFLSWVYSLFASLSLAKVHLLGRINSAFWGTISIPMLYLLGDRLYGRTVGLLSALFLSVVVIHIQMSHFFTPDVTLVFFLIATIYFSSGLMKTGSIRDYIYAGVAAGVGMASKYWAPAILPLIVAHITRLTSSRTFGWEENKKLLLSMIISGIAFFILSPYVILDAGNAIPKILWWAKKTTGEIPQIWAYHFEGTIPYLFQIKHNIPWAMGWPLAIISGAGFILVLVRRRKEDILLASWIIINFLLIGSWYIKSIRYVLPIVPFLCLSAAVLITSMLTRHRLRALGTAAGLGAFLWSAAFSFAFLNIYSVTHSKTRASEWIYKNIPTGSKIASDHSIPLGTKNGLPELFQEEHLDFPYLFDSNLSDREKRDYLSGILERSDYIIIADELREYFKTGPRDYPVERELLKRIFSGDSEFVLLETFKTYPKLGPWRWRDDEAELSFHFFDHPAVYIFQRN